MSNKCDICNKEKVKDYNRYFVINHGESDYQTLCCPCGNEILTLTEPEDRNFDRDLSPILEHLNKLLNKENGTRNFASYFIGFLGREQKQRDHRKRSFYNEIIGLNLSEVEKDGFDLLQKIKFKYGFVSEELHILEEDSPEIKKINREYENPISLFIIFNKKTNIITDITYGEWDGYGEEYD